MEKAELIRSKSAKRISFAAKRGQELGTSIRQWGEQNPIELESYLAEDKLSWKATLKFNAAPELDDWNHIFGDSIHNLHSLLNNMLAQIARDEGLSEKVISKIQFPICTEVAQWSKNKSRLQSLPETVQIAVEQMQPYHRPNFDGRPATQDPLAILSELSNQDKHRMELVPSIELNQIAHNFAIKFEEEPKADLRDVMNRMILDGRFADGVQVITHNTTPYRIDQIIGRAEWRGHVVVATDKGNNYSPAEVLNVLVPYVANVVDHVLGAWSTG